MAETLLAENRPIQTLAQDTDTMINLDITAKSDTFSISIFDLPLAVDAPGVLSNDSDLDGDTLKAIVETPAENGAVDLNEDGSFFYSPNPGFIGVDSFTYIAFDETGSSVATNVAIEVKFLPDAPPDAMRGKNNADTLRGTNAEDYILGLEGSDRIIGRQGNDTIGGGNGNDTVFGRSGEDVIDGGIGNDKLDGGRDQDIIFGGAGNDSLKGQRGDDLLIGGNGNDTLRGHSGNDTLIGGNGEDFLQGGEDTDIFVLSPSSGLDRFNDFVQGEDIIALTNDLSFDDLSFESLGEITSISFDGEVIAMVQLRGTGNLDTDSNFIEF